MWDDVEKDNVVDRFSVVRVNFCFRKNDGRRTVAQSILKIRVIAKLRGERA